MSFITKIAKKLSLSGSKDENSFEEQKYLFFC